MTRRQLWITLSALMVAALAASRLTVHGDLHYIARIAHAVARGHLNVYQYFFTTPSLNRDIGGLTCPPLAYLFFGGAMAIGRLFGLFGAPIPAIPGLWLTPTEVLYLRVWYVPFVLLIGWVTRRFYQEFFHPGEETPCNARLAQVVGTACPITLFVSFSFGQFDVLPASLLYLGVYLLCRGRVLLGVLSVFGGIWLKNFPIVYLIIALPVIIGAYGPKRALGSVAIGIALTWAMLWPFRGPGLDASYLAFQYANFDVIAWSWGNVKPNLTDQLLVLLLLTSVVLASVRTNLENWQKLVLLYLCSLVAVLAPRFWMPQYFAWIAPVFLLSFLAGLSLESALASILYLAVAGAYLMATPALFPFNVDIRLFINAGIAPAGIPAPGFLVGLDKRQALLWSATAILLCVAPVIPAVRFLAPGWFAARAPARRLSLRTQLLTTAALSLAIYFGYIGIHMGHIAKYRYDLRHPASAAHPAPPPRH